MSTLFFQLVMARSHHICNPNICRKCQYVFLQEILVPLVEANGDSASTVLRVPRREISKHRAWMRYLALELLRLPISEFVKLRYWEGYLGMAFHFLGGSDLQSSILELWFKSYLGNVNFVDWVIFYPIRYFYLHTPIGDRWIEAALELAERTKDESLVESLVLILRPNISDYPSFASLARELAGQSRVISKVLNVESANQRRPPRWRR